MDFKQLRSSKKYTQEGLARKAGCTRLNIANIEHGKYKPKYELAKNIAAILEVDTEKLYRILDRQKRKKASR